MQTIKVTSILNKRKHRDSWFLDDYTLNAFSGCSFNCLYCYIRGSKYGENVEMKVSLKENAEELLDRQLSLRARKKQYGYIVMSSATDPYLHFEKDSQITRHLLEIILKHRFPLHLITKSPALIRDLDLLKEIEERAIVPADLPPHAKGTILSFSFSTIDDAVAKIFETGAPLPSERLQALKLCAEQGFHCGVSMMPLLPYIGDTGESLERMCFAFKTQGARYLLASTLTLFGSAPGDSKTMVLRAVKKHYPEILPRYEKLFAASHGLPAYYQKAFSEKMKELSLRHGLRLKIF